MKRFLLLLSIIICVQVVAQQKKSDPYDTFITGKMKTDSFPGAVLLITKNGKPVKLASYGFSNLEHQVKTIPETVFELASNIKIFIRCSCFT
jgi:CubicO group peptidase (beta-lactamase class C family)